MMKEREQLAEAILNHALEIICLLTVEDFIVVKRPLDATRCTFSIRAAEINRNVCESPSGCPELLFTLLGMEAKTQKMIADLANKIVWLLTREVPVKCEDVSVSFSKDKRENLEGHREPYKNNQDTCTIEQPAAPVQQTENSLPMKCRIKEEPRDEPHHVPEQPTAPVQRSSEKRSPVKCHIKEEPDEEPQRVTDGILALPSLEFIPGRQEEKPLLPPVNVRVPLIEPQTPSEFSFKSSCDIKPQHGGRSSEITLKSVDGDRTSALPSAIIPGSKPLLPTVIVHVPFMEAQTPSGFGAISSSDIKRQPAGGSSGNTMGSVGADGTSALPSVDIIPGNPERKPFLPTVIVHIPFMEPQSASGFSFISSSNIKPQPGGGSSENTTNSVVSESPQFPLPSDQGHVYSNISHIRKEAEGKDSCMPVSGDTIIQADCTYKDEDYLPPKPHQDQEQTSLPCGVCGKVLSSKWSLEKHLQIHTGQRPFPCNECGKRFSCKNHLTTHKRSHSGERPYPCDQCGRRFFKHQHLVLHRVVHTGEKPYSCPVCGKGFTRQSSVVKHSGMHAEEKRHVCKECGKSYCQYASLVVHQRLHSGEKPFVCKHCERAFTCKATMLKHQSAHTE